MKETFYITLKVEVDTNEWISDEELLNNVQDEIVSNLDSCGAETTVLSSGTFDPRGSTHITWDKEGRRLVNGVIANDRR